MRALGLGLAGVLLTAGAGLAAGPMESYFGNTIVVEIPGFGGFEVMYSPDNTYRSAGPMGEAQGTWAYADGQVCRTQTAPAPMPGQPNPNCGEIQARSIGETWQYTGSNGQTVTLTLKAGQD